MTSMTRLAARTPVVPGLDHILVATDFSLDGDRAIRRAAVLPLRRDAQISLVHVLPAAPNRSADSVVLGAAEQELERAEVKLVDWLEAAGQSRVTVRLRLIRGSAAEEISRLAQATRPDLIVMGRRGTRSLRELLLGSTAQRVVRGARFPVLIVAKPPREAYRCLVAGFDFSPDALRAARVGARLIPPVSRAIAVHASLTGGDPASARQLARKVRRAMPKRPGSAQWQLVVGDDDPRRLILDVTRDRTADLIALGSLGRTGVGRVLIGSVAEGVLQHAAADVLIVPTRDVR
ncbi:MAG: universal stress protein [Gemmatimonadota bacterium]